jgi:hypothetical protein
MVAIGGGDLSGDLGVGSDMRLGDVVASQPYLDCDRECVGQSALCVTIRPLTPVGDHLFSRARGKEFHQSTYNLRSPLEPFWGVSIFYNSSRWLGSGRTGTALLTILPVSILMFRLTPQQIPVEQPIDLFINRLVNATFLVRWYNGQACYPIGQFVVRQAAVG